MSTWGAISSVQPLSFLANSDDCDTGVLFLILSASIRAVSV